MKACDKKLRDSLLRVMAEEEAMIREEMKLCEPHVFSDEFERKMAELMKVERRKSKRREIIRYVVTAAAVVLLVGGLIFIGSEDLNASGFGINILEWMENFFVVENDTNRDKDENVGVLFEESQIGYLPEGFEKVKEQIMFSKVCYKFQNDLGEYIALDVRSNKSESIVDNEEIGQEIALNAAGLEYRYMYKVDSKENVVTWRDKEGIYYYLQGTYDKEEIIKIMNSISY